MPGYAVVWRAGNGRLVAGGLEFDPHGLWLSDGEKSRRVRVEVPYDEIVDARLDAGARIGPSTGIRVETQAAGTLVITTLERVLLPEILDRLNEVVAEARKTRARAAEAAREARALSEQARAVKAQAEHQTRRAARIAQESGERDSRRPHI
jgi:hypothetical protein